MNMSLTHFLPRRTTLAGIIVACSFLFFLVNPVHAVSSPAAQLELIQQLMEMIVSLKAQLESLQAQPSVDSYTGNPLYSCELSQSLWFGASDATTNGQVGILQKFLKNTGDFTYGEITGLYGPATVSAVQKWQKRNGIISYGTPDTTGYGTVGEATIKAMRKGCEYEETTPSSIQVAVTDITDSENPTISGTAKGAGIVGFSISDEGGKVYGSDQITVVNGSWSHKVHEDLVRGEEYEVIVYVDNIEYTRESFTIRQNLDVESVSSEVTKKEDGSGVFMIEFEVTATDDGEILIPMEHYGSFSNSKGEKVSTVSSFTLSSTADKDGKFYIIDEGNTETFKLMGSLKPTYSENYRMYLESLTYYGEDGQKKGLLLDSNEFETEYATLTGTGLVEDVAEPSLSISSGPDVNGILKAELKLPKKYDGYYVLFIQNPVKTKTPVSSGALLETKYFFPGPLTTTIDITRAHEGFATNPGGVHWFSIPTGTYRLTAVLYKESPFRPGTEMEYYPVGKEPAAVLILDSKNYKLVNKNIKEPTLSLTASPSTITAGEGVKLSWKSWNTNYCTVFGDKDDIADSIIQYPEATKEYSITCYGDGGSVTKTVRVDVENVQSTSCKIYDIYAEQVPGYVYYNLYIKTNGELADKVEGGTLLGITGAESWDNLKFTNDTSSGQPASTYIANQTLSGTGASYVLSHKNNISLLDPSGNVICPAMSVSSSKVNQTQSSTTNPVAPIVNLSVSPTSVEPGGSVKLSWSSTNANYCTMGDKMDTSGTQIIDGITATKEYIVTCVGYGGSVAKSVTVNVMTKAEGAPRNNEMNCDFPKKTGLKTGEVACYGIWDYGDDFGSDQYMCGLNKSSSGYSDQGIGCTVKTPACASMSAVASRVIKVGSASKDDIALLVNNLGASENIIRAGLLNVWEYLCIPLPPVPVASASLVDSNQMCVDISRNMHRGAESSTVLSLQKFLAGKGLLTTDGITSFYGDMTVSGVKAYQKSVGLPETGMVYEFTRNAIKKETCTP